MASDRGVVGDDGGWIVVGRVLIETLVRAVVVEMVRVAVEDRAGVSLVVDQQSVGAFVADAANEPFGVAVCLGRPGRDLDDVEAFRGEDGIESFGELGVSVADQERERGDPLAEVHQKIPGGLGSPGRGRMSSYAEDVDSSGAYFHDEQHIESVQGDGVNSEEVGGQQPGGLSAEEGSPAGVCSAWCGAEAGGGQDPADGACAEAVPETEQFALDATVAPGGILLRQAQHELTDLAADGWATGLVWVGPLPSNQATVPGQQRGLGNNPMQTPPMGEQAGQGGEDRTIRPGGTSSGDLTAQHRDLVAHDEDLDVLGCGPEPQVHDPHQRGAPAMPRGS
jgi:hypothetical protein